MFAEWRLFMMNFGGCIMNRITVAPVQGGWSVLSPLSAGPLMFLAAADAEAQARRLAGSPSWR
jgi:hypothetical protein